MKIKSISCFKCCWLPFVNETKSFMVRALVEKHQVNRVSPEKLECPLQISRRDVLIGLKHWVYDMKSLVGASSGNPREAARQQKSDSGANRHVVSANVQWAFKRNSHEVLLSEMTLPEVHVEKLLSEILNITEEKSL